MIRLIVIAEENTDLFSFQKKKKVKGKTQLGCSSLKRGEDPQQGPTSRGLWAMDDADPWRSNV
jgi:hypothetical protein